MFADRPLSAVPEDVPPDRLWRLRDVAAGFALLLVAFVTVVAALTVVHAREMTALVLGTLAFECSLGVIVLGLAARRRLSLRSLGFVLPRSWWPLTTAWFGAYVIMAGYAVLLWFLGRIGLDVSRFQGGNPVLVDSHTAPAVLAAVGAVVIVIAPPCEELFFRAFVYRAVRGYWGVALASLISGVVFALFHLNPAVIVPFALIGALFAWSFETSGSLWTSIIAHALVNSLSFVLSIVVGPN